MKTVLVLLMAWLSDAPGHQFQFPRDFANHPAYQAEGWHYAGHLQTEAGRRYGYALRFFRSGEDRTPTHLAHFAVTDEHGKRFFYDQRVNRQALAGADDKHYRVWNGDWQAELVDANHELSAQTGDFQLELVLTPLKKPVIHGEHGISRKGSCASCASHHYSFTRMGTRGTLVIQGKPQRVLGLSWMDHEFGSSRPEAHQVGWDRFSLQLDDEREWMLYLLRDKHGRSSPFSSGTLVRKDGSSRHLKRSEFTIQVLDRWRSPQSGGVYPSAWRIRVPSENLDVQLRPTVADQERLTMKRTAASYWEGGVDVSGSQKGHGYVELTGYEDIRRPSVTHPTDR